MAEQITGFIKHFGHYLNGEWKQGEQKFAVYNPATGQEIAQVADGGQAEAQQAIDAAHEAFQTWSKTTARERSIILSKWSALIRKHRNELAQIMTLENGKPIREAAGEVAYGNEYVTWYAEEAKRIYGDTVPSSAPNQRLVVIRQPVGVTAAITPWNFPSSMITRKVAPALAAGCTVVLKPAEQTPLSAIALFQLLEEAGLPAGVVNLVLSSNPAPVGEEFLTNRKVRKVGFTGSTEVGKLLMRGSAEQVKRVSLELGGHAPFIVFPDADLDMAVRGLQIAKFLNAGQACVAANRIFVHESILEEFGQAFAARVNNLKVGSGFEDGVRIGPLIDEPSFAKVSAQVEDAVSGGAKLLVGGGRNEEAGDGYFFQPTVLSGVTESMRIFQEETFGPVAPLIPFKTEEEVIARANDTHYGLAAYVYTRDLGVSWRVSEALEYGMVGVNDPNPGVPQGPFGGWKESGLGREGGKYGIEPFLETKLIAVSY